MQVLREVEWSLRIAMLNANGEKLRAFFARERLFHLVIQDAQIRQETVIYRSKFPEAMSSRALCAAATTSTLNPS